MKRIFSGERMYVIGRFYSLNDDMDTYAGILEHLVSLHKYQYVNANLVMYTDNEMLGKKIMR